MGHLWRLDWDRTLRELVLAEGEVLGAGEQVAPGLFRSERPYDPGAAAYGLAGGPILAEGTPEELRAAPELAPGTQVHVARGPWKLSGTPLAFLAQLGPGVTHANRGCSLELYVTDTRWYLVERSGSPTFQAPELPHRTSTSTSSQFARAVVNLVARSGDVVVDPVCGTGVLLVEAARIGCTVRGSDTNVKACHFARANLGSLGVEPDVVVRDASASADGVAADVVVGDLPYGRRLAASDFETLACTVAGRAPRFALIAHVDVSEALRDAGLSPRQVIEVPKTTFSRYVIVGERGRR